MNLEPDLSWNFPDNLDGNASRIPYPFSRVGGVSEGKFYEGKTAARCLEQRYGAIAILHRRRVDLQRQRPAVCIDHGVPLAALDLLARIIAARAASLGCFHALAVDDGGTWAGFTTGTLAVEHDHAMVDRLPNASVLPGREPAIDSLPRWKTGRQHPPWDAAPKDIKHGVNQLAQRPGGWSPDSRNGRKERRQHGPFVVRHITGEAEPLTHMLRAGGCGPHGFVHPTRSRQPVGTTSYRDHPTPIPLAFRDSLFSGRVFRHDRAGRLNHPQLK